MTQAEKGVLPDIGTVATVEIDGLSVRYARSGVPKGTPILLTAPWPESIYSFHRVLPRLAIEYSLIAVDLPGDGPSQSRPDIMAPEAMGDFVISLLKHFGISRTHVVAPDVGTLAVLFAASKNPDLFESLVLGSGAMRADQQLSSRTSGPLRPVGALKKLLNMCVGIFPIFPSSNRSCLASKRPR